MAETSRDSSYTLPKSAGRWAQKWALITGASAGIGLALAEQLAGAGSNLVLTARRTDRLQQLAADLTAKNGVQVEVFGADLVQPEAPDQIYDFTKAKNIEIELLINNAGFGAFGNNHEIAPRRLAEMIQVNCAAVVHLTSLFVPPMVERKRGDVLIVASTAAFQPVPFIAAYAATKAFDLIFAEGIAEELRPLGYTSAHCAPARRTRNSRMWRASRTGCSGWRKRREKLPMSVWRGWPCGRPWLFLAG